MTAVTISLDRPTVSPAETERKLHPVPAGDAHLAACALHLLLAQHPEIVAIPFSWRIDPDSVIRPGLPVDDPQAVTATELLAKALELPMDTSAYTSGCDGEKRVCVSVKGRWGGAEWRCDNYGIEQAPVLRAVTS